MKITYEWDTDSENFNSAELEIFQNAEMFSSALFKIDQFCRSKLKYTEDIPDREERWLEEIRLMVPDIVR